MSPLRLTLTTVALAALVLMAAAIAMIFFVAEEDSDQGLSQKIFFFHVPIALTAYACFGFGAWKALRLLWKGGERYDLESYTAIHQGTIFGALTLHHRRDLGEGLVGRLVDVELQPARPVPRPVPLLLRLLHAALLDRGRASARARLGRVRAVRRGADPRQLPRHPPGQRLHPPHRLHTGRSADDKQDVRRLLRRVGRDPASPTSCTGSSSRASAPTPTSAS